MIMRSLKQQLQMVDVLLLRVWMECDVVLMVKGNSQIRNHCIDYILKITGETLRQAFYWDIVNNVLTVIK